MPTTLIALFITIVTFSYAGLCWLKPFTLCHRCRGTGDSPRRLLDRLRYRQTSRVRPPRGRHPCPRCRHTGLRLRHGRRLYNRLSRLRRDAHH
jgi:hypothetical protein